MISQSINSYKLPLCARHTGSVVVTTEESLLKELLCSGGVGWGEMVERLGSSLHPKRACISF